MRWRSILVSLGIAFVSLLVPVDIDLRRVFVTGTVAVEANYSR